MNGGIREPANAAHPAQSNELLGLPGEARVLIINVDDFGLYTAVNAAVIHSESGRLRVHLQATLDLAEAAKAHELLESGSVTGKIALTV
jgi:chitin disaccharide deacetylase